jgi:arginase
MPLRKTIAIVEAPSNLGLMPTAPGIMPGTLHAPDAFREAGLGTKLRAMLDTRVPAPAYHPKTEALIGIRNATPMAGYSKRLGEAVEKVVRRDQFALVIGGDCSILLGSLIGLRKIGRFGLVFIDGHTDFHTPDTSRSAGAAGMDLALATGRGPDLLTNINNLKPYVRDSDVFLIGNRDITNPEKYPARAIFDSKVNLFTLEKLREWTIDSVARAAIQRFEESAVAGFFVHLDVDVLDSTLMPAVDSPMPGGMNYQELARLLRRFIDSDMVVGMEITIYDPTKDPDRRYLTAFLDALMVAFSVVNG